MATTLPGVLLLESAIHHDERGWFMEAFHESRWHDALAAQGLPVPRFVQENQSCSRRGVLRGLHFQAAPHQQGKLVRVARGASFDVAVDLRPSSPTFGRWEGFDLTAANGRQVWIPPGFAHGFLALEDDTHLIYKTTAFWHRDSERALAWNDPTVAIAWPLDQVGGMPTVSAKDNAAAPLGALRLD